jgi:hypothetical protein
MTNLLELILMSGLKDSIAGNVVSLLAHIFSHLSQKIAIADANGLE